MNTFHTNGFGTINNVFSVEEVANILTHLSTLDTSNPTFRKSSDLFAIRQFVKEVPFIKPLLCTRKFKQLISDVAGPDYFLVKSIYFDKPETSNWFVAYHQDLTISVDKKMEMEGFGPWTVKHNQFAVQPPLEILKNIVTFRIHLDDTNEENGALKVIPGSHLKNIYRPETIDWQVEREEFCPVNAGGVMLMKPLLLHASNKTTNNTKRRVIHLEFSNMELPEGLGWAEKSEWGFM
jgi:ectoine hydroxylase-related dioxygenase (phytanoyl-CoA dioxygenase family)